jgi:hypothetical protein
MIRKLHLCGIALALQALVRLINQFAQGEMSPELNDQPGNPAYKRVWTDPDFDPARRAFYDATTPA